MDFSLDSLFRVRTEVNLPGGETVTVRALSEYEMSARERHAQAEAARFVKRLSDEGSDDYAAIVLPILQSSHEARIAAMKIYFQTEARRVARERNAPNYIPIPDNATEEEERRILIEREAEIERVEARRREDANKIYSELERSLEKMGEEEVLRVLIEKTKEYAAMSVKAREMVSYTIHIATLRPDGSKRFTLQEAREMPEGVREIILSAFSEVNNKDPLSLSG